MVEKILNNTTPYGKIRASHEGLLHSSTLNMTFTWYSFIINIIKCMINYFPKSKMAT